MAISAGRLTQMISVLNPVLTRNAAGEMTEEWVSCGKIHADIRGRSSRDHTYCPLTGFRGKTSIFSHPVYLFLRKFSLQDSRGGS